MLDSTVLTIGTALRRAQNAEMTVQVLMHGQWLTGRVLGLDGYGAFLDDRDGDSAVIRLEDVCAVKVHQVEPRHAAPREDSDPWEQQAPIHSRPAPAGITAIG